MISLQYQMPSNAASLVPIRVGTLYRITLLPLALRWRIPLWAYITRWIIPGLILSQFIGMVQAQWILPHTGAIAF